MRNLEVKRKLWELVDEHRGELLGICSDLIRIPSVDAEGIEEILGYVCRFFEGLGIGYEVFRPVDETPCIVAQVGVDGGAVGIFNGHNDVVETGDVSRWDFDPFCGTITDSQILGRGASDMKCGVAVFLFIAKMIVENGLKLKGKLKFHIVHDEEKGGEKGSLWLTEHGFADGADFCIVTEPTSYNNIEIGQKGSARLRLRTYGKPVNGTVINYVGESAVHNMLRVLSRINELSELEGTVTAAEADVIADSKFIICKAMGLSDVGAAIDHVNVNISNVTGGSGSTMTAEVCEATVGLGVPFMITRAQVHEKLMAIINETGVRCDVEYVRWKDGAGTDINSALVRSVVENCEYVRQRKIWPTYQWATSDAKYYRYLGIPAIQYGPSNNRGVHSYNENVEIIDIVNCAKTHFAVVADLIGFDEEWTDGHRLGADVSLAARSVPMRSSINFAGARRGMSNMDIKTRIWALAEDTKKDLLNLCSELVKRPNVNPPIEADAITAFIENYFKTYGIAYERLEPYAGKPILVARVGDGNGPEICINGHTDTVPTGDLSQWDFDPYCGTVTQTQVLGRGTSDMLCGVAIGMHMARLIAQGRVRLHGSLVLHLVSDEESGGDYGTRWLVENGYADGFAGVLLPEPTSWNNFETGQKGGVTYIVKCTGTQAHMSVCSFHHDHAIFKMMALLGRLEQMREIQSEYSSEQLAVVEYSKEIARTILKNQAVGDAIDHVTYNVRYISSGDETRSPYEYCEAQVAFGIPVGVDKEAVKKVFDDLIAATGYEGFSCEIVRDKEPSYTPVDAPVIQIGLENASHIWGKKVVPVYQWAGSDAKYYRYRGIPALQYGPANIDGVHGYSECADIEEIINIQKTYWGILADMLGLEVIG